MVFRVPSLKIHSKLCLITRHENGEAVRYAHIGTGNFNEKTAKIYTDFSLLTRHPDITAEVESVFEYIEYPYRRYKFNHLLVSPSTAAASSIASSTTSWPTPGRATQRHHPQDQQPGGQRPHQPVLCRRPGRGAHPDDHPGHVRPAPGVPGLSDNIRVISIIDRFLEHPRVMVFHNKGNPQLYISSADWMSRNIDGRIEVGTPSMTSGSSSASSIFSSYN